MTKRTFDFCFLCKYIIRGGCRTVFYGGKPKRCCTKCTSREHKALKIKYSTLKCDLKCSGCCKAVYGNNCI